MYETDILHCGLLLDSRVILFLLNYWYYVRYTVVN